MSLNYCLKIFKERTQTLTHVFTSQSGQNSVKCRVTAALQAELLLYQDVSLGIFIQRCIQNTPS